MIVASKNGDYGAMFPGGLRFAMGPRFLDVGNWKKLSEVWSTKKGSGQYEKSTAISPAPWVTCCFFSGLCSNSFSCLRIPYLLIPANTNRRYHFSTFGNPRWSLLFLWIGLWAEIHFFLLTVQASYYFRESNQLHAVLMFGKWHVYSHRKNTRAKCNVI